MNEFYSLHDFHRAFWAYSEENDERLDEMINSLDEEPEDDRWCDGFYGVNYDDEPEEDD